MLTQGSHGHQKQQCQLRDAPHLGACSVQSGASQQCNQARLEVMLETCRIRAPGGDTEALLQVAAQLYQIQGRYDLALAIYLRQQQPAVFDFIQEHHLLPVLHERVAQLLSIDEERATQLLMDQYDEVPASTVVPSIQVSLPPAHTSCVHMH